MVRAEAVGTVRKTEEKSKHITIFPAKQVGWKWLEKIPQTVAGTGMRGLQR